MYLIISFSQTRESENTSKFHKIKCWNEYASILGTMPTKLASIDCNWLKVYAMRKLESEIIEIYNMARQMDSVFCPSLTIAEYGSAEPQSVGCTRAHVLHQAVLHLLQH